MLRRTKYSGFTLIEVIVSLAILMLFVVGVYGAATFVLKIVYRSRITVLETALLSEELEVARNLPYDAVGILGGNPAGLLTANKTVVRDGITFNLISTVRNVDDPYDGTIGGSPNDTSPADYKIVEISSICISCSQQTRMSLSTTVGPKGLEGSSKNGALFIQVFDVAGQPVVGATVHVVNASSSPPINLFDTTDQFGYYRLVDTPTGTASYAITISKNGYSSDGTVTSTVINPNPIKPPANVVSQNVTDISFSIDQLSSLTLHTVNLTCVAVGSVGFNLIGQKMLGKGPDIYKYNNNYTTDGSGNKALGNTEFDTYTASLTGTTYDIAGSIPINPFFLIPGSSQDVTLVLKARSTNSLLVNVIDSATKLPVSNAAVRVYGGAYDNSLLTGVGYIRQTDWSGGAGLATFTDGRYFSDNGSITNNNPAGDIILKKSGTKYATSGWLESSTIDFGSVVNFTNLVINPTTQPPQAGSQPLVFSIATSNSSTPASWSFTGPDGTAATYYTSTSTQINSINNGKRYLRYRAYLFTANTSYTPRLSELAFLYTNSCTPPGQSFFDSLSAATYNVDVSASGYVSASTTIDVAGSDRVLINLAQTP